MLTSSNSYLHTRSLVNTLGLMVAVVVTAANTDDRQGLVALGRSSAPWRGSSTTVAYSRDYEWLMVSSEAMIQMSMIRLLLKRLA